MANFVVPARKILQPTDMPAWQSSKAYKDYMRFLLDLNQSVTGKDNVNCSPSENVSRIVQLLETLDKWIDDVPPLQQAQRFGNQAFRTYHTRLTERAGDILRLALPDSVDAAALEEVVPYLVDSFGNSTRIDYGTGHEANFIMFLCCLSKLGVFQKSDFPAVVVLIFKRYLELCRRLQLTYRMEPAGSHGVWSLDDFQFVPFIWGSAQLIDHPNYDTRSFLEDTIVARTKDDLLWMGAIDFINKVKTGPFAEHSNQLWNISGVASWSKINSGLIKKYEAEVLQKFPVAQHFLFGSLLSFEAA
ncbi:Serine/threonine-protein phosphatase 2A activator [Hypsibius exemplaris]|uniref:Serine/threonine-protein phosphatase 2A activator n=1 Tax=Hypsibius exemplaris TaxID=2072580 RepID=A0A1W0WKW8_HYPEX|nr:Serine/threonine-protein phosphatase 2A activator [Hypsibius exemplaris]